MYCSKCGNFVDKGNMFCPNCGNRMNNEITHKPGNLENGFWQDIKSFVYSHKTGIGILVLIASLFFILCAVIDLIQTGGNSSSDSWRGASAPTSSTGPMDIMLIGLGVLGIFMSIKFLKLKK